MDSTIQCCFMVFLISALYQVVAVKPVLSTRPPSHQLLNHAKIVDKVNNHPNAGWKATIYPRFANFTHEKSKRLFGGKPTPEHLLHTIPTLTHPQQFYNQLPQEFDARTAWPHCSTIREIRDQGHCGSCWAFATVEALADRHCVSFGESRTLSANDVLSCCGRNYCGDCDLGSPHLAWAYFYDYGVVSEECDPYFDQEGCDHRNCPGEYPTPRCEKKCRGNQYLDWTDDKYYVNAGFQIRDDPYSIMAEVYLRGPVTLLFEAYEDFIYYGSGVYRHVAGEKIFNHVVKLIGWGTTEEGTDYWLLANQWNRGWGEDGFFRMLRGRNECNIEKQMDAGIPSLTYFPHQKILG